MERVVGLGDMMKSASCMLNLKGPWDFQVVIFREGESGEREGGRKRERERVN